jgi:hypothetical protein
MKPETKGKDSPPDNTSLRTKRARMKEKTTQKINLTRRRKIMQLASYSNKIRLYESGLKLGLKSTSLASISRSSSV